MRLLILISSIAILSCGQGDTKQKDLELKEKELALNEKELQLKEKELGNSTDTTQSNKSGTQTTSSTIQENQSIPTPKVQLTRASNVTPKCDDRNSPTGNHSLIDLYCGALGQKPIEIYITGVDVSSKSVFGYSMVGNSRTNFEGTFTTQKHKAASRQADNVVDVPSTIYKLILREPSQANKNGVFNLELDISDIGRTGYGTWTSYDGMLYREIKIIDRLNDL